jgi:20S proteasome alpha/beta subunit
MAEKVAKVGIKRKKGYLYYVDKKGNVVETKMARGKAKGGGGKVIARPGVKKAKGYLYFIDKAGDVGRAKMLVGGKRKKKR